METHEHEKRDTMEPNFIIEVHNIHIHLRCTERFAALLLVAFIRVALRYVVAMLCFAMPCFVLFLFCCCLVFALLGFD